VDFIFILFLQAQATSDNPQAQATNYKPYKHKRTAFQSQARAFGVSMPSDNKSWIAFAP
jgi:hypothetical protein